MSDQALSYKPTLGKVVRPTQWFSGGHAGLGEGGAVAIGASQATVYQPTDAEKDLLLKYGPCQSCKWFNLQSGQERLERERTTQRILYEFRLDTLLESVDPRELGNCAVKEHALVHRMSTCESYTPLPAAAALWRKVKGFISREKDDGRLP